MQLVIDQPFWELFPDATIGVVVARDIDNQPDGRSTIGALLQAAVADASTRLGEADLATHPAIAPWRDAYRRFGMKPAKFRSSIENLLRSARAHGIREINPLVDIYNAVSLKHWLPCGGEDLRTVRGDIHLTRASGGEYFVPLGSSEEQPPQPGEVIYHDDEGVLCRSWNWREAERTKLTPDTSNAILVIEGLPEMGRAAVEAACTELANLVRQHLGGQTSVELLNASNPSVSLIE
jgi:DNA/RNA-binding domain of Phe-tRNA-synthetase-like protein